MKTEKSSLYDELPLELLTEFFYKKIEKGILSNAMYHEIRLIEQSAFKRGISLEYPHDKVHK